MDISIHVDKQKKLQSLGKFIFESSRAGSHSVSSFIKHFNSHYCTTIDPQLGFRDSWILMMYLLDDGTPKKDRAWAMGMAKVGLICDFLRFLFPSFS